MLVSLLLFVAPHDGKEVEELLLQLALWKYMQKIAVFGLFSCRPGKNFQVAADRTILTPVG